MGNRSKHISGASRRLGWVTAVALLTSCAQGGLLDSGVSLRDGAPRDSGARDAGPRPDAMGIDSSITLRDSGGIDAGMREAGTGDAGPMCSGPTDCDDGDACTVDTCDLASCVNAPMVVSGSDCASAIDISAGGAFSGDSSCALDEYSGACGAGDSPDVSFVLVLSATTTVTLDASGTSFDSVLSIGTSCAGGEVGCDDDSAGGGDAMMMRTDLSPGTYQVVLDGKAGATGGAWSLNVTLTTGPVSEVVSFPSTSDTVSRADGLFWVLGDFVEGSRTTSLPSVTGAMMTVSIFNNMLTCDTQDMRMMINGTEVGRFSINPGASSVSSSFSFSAITGPTYLLRYENVRTVSAGCGQAQVGPGGTVTLVR